MCETSKDGSYVPTYVRLGELVGCSRKRFACTHAWNAKGVDLSLDRRVRGHTTITYVRPRSPPRVKLLLLRLSLARSTSGFVWSIHAFLVELCRLYMAAGGSSAVTRTDGPKYVSQCRLSCVPAAW